MRDPYIVRRRRTGIETGYLKRITELEAVCLEQKEIIKGFVEFTNEIPDSWKNLERVRLINRAKKIVEEGV